jgi:hypothetical protein
MWRECYTFPHEVGTRQSLVKTDGCALALPGRETLCRVCEKDIIPARRMAFDTQEPSAVWFANAREA